MTDLVLNNIPYKDGHAALPEQSSMQWIKNGELIIGLL